MQHLDAVSGQTPAPAPPASGPWTLGDIGKALAFVVAVVIVFGTAFGLIAIEIAGSADAVEDDPDALAVQLAASLVLPLTMVGASIYFARKHRLSWKNLGLRKPERGGYWLAPALYVGIMVLALVYGAVVEALFGLPDTELPNATFEKAAPAIIAGVLAVGLAPIGEEIFFRGFVFGGLNERGQFWLAAVASGALFGLAHLLNPGGYAVFPVIAGIGFILAWGYYYSGSILPSIGAHFLFNLQAFSYQAITS